LEEFQELKLSIEMSSLEEAFLKLSSVELQGDFKRRFDPVLQQLFQFERT
jgi:hypothetical protein